MVVEMLTPAEEVLVEAVKIEMQDPAGVVAGFWLRGVCCSSIQNGNVAPVGAVAVGILASQ